MSRWHGSGDDHPAPRVEVEKKDPIVKKLRYSAAPVSWNNATFLIIVSG
jgi:hypothetical protein